MSIDFTRPKGINEGVLLNSNNEALQIYKRTKKRMASIPQLEERLIKLEEMVMGLLSERKDD